MDLNQNTNDAFKHMSPCQKDFMSIDELAEWIGVCKNTITNWMQSGTLAPGVDYLCVNRVVRFIPTATINTLLKKSLAAGARLSNGESANTARKHISRRTKNRPNINLDI